MAENQLIIDVSLRNNTADGARAALVTLASIGREAAKIDLGDTKGLDKALFAQARAASVLSNIKLATAANVASDKAALDSLVANANKFVDSLEKEGAAVGELRQQIQLLHAQQSQRIDTSESERQIDLANRANQLQAQILASAGDAQQRQEQGAQAVTAAIEQRITALEREGVQVDNLRAALKQLQQADATRASTASAQQRLELEARVLALRVGQIETERQLAAAAGDYAEVNRTTNELIQAQAQYADVAADRQIAALREQFKGRADLNALLDKAEAGLRRNVELENRLARATGGRGRSFDFGGAQIGGQVDRLVATFTSGFGPAGAALRDITQGVGNVNGGLDGLIAKAGLSRGALLGLGVGVTVIGGVAVALKEAANRAQELDDILASAAARGPGRFSEDLQGYRNIADQAPGASTVGQKSSFAATNAAANFFTKPQEIQAVVRPAILAQVANFAKAEDAANALGAAMQRWQIPASAGTDTLNQLAAASSVANIDLLKLEAAARDTAPEFRELGIKFQESISLLASTKQSTGADLADITRGYQRLLSVATKEGDPARKALEDFAGVDFSQPITNLGDFIGLIDQIRSKLDALPKDRRNSVLFNAFGDARSRGPVLDVLKTSGQGVRSVLLAVNTDIDILGRKAREAGAEGEKAFDRLSNSMLKSFSELGRAVSGAAGSILGPALDLPGSVKLPDEFINAAGRAKQAVIEGNLEVAKAVSAEIDRLTDDVSNLYSRQYGSALEEEFKRQKQAVIDSLPSDENGPAYALLPSDDKIREESRKALQASYPDFAGVFTRTRDQVRDSVRSMVKAIETDSKQSPAKLTARFKFDAASADLDKALKSLPVPNIDLGVTVLPENIQAAIETLRTLSAKSSQGPLLPDDQGKATEAIESIERYKQSQSRLASITDQVNARTLSGLDKQAAEYDKLERDVQEFIDTFEGAPAAVDKLRAGLERLKEVNAAALDTAQQDKAANLYRDRLNLQIQSIEKARQLATVQGDTARADQLSIDLIEKRRDLARSEADSRIVAFRQSIDGYEVSEELQKSIESSIIEQVYATEAVEKATQRVAEAERNRANAARLASIGSEALQGLDAELDAIERNKRARQDAESNDRATGKFQVDDATFAKVLRFYDLIAERDAAVAQRNAKVFQLDALSAQLSGLSRDYAEQTKAIDLTRLAERNRLVDGLRASGAQAEAIKTITDAYDLLTDKQREAAAISFSQDTSAALSEQKLLTDAYREAQREAASLGLTREQSLQREIDLLEQAKNGVEALSSGLEAGRNDALRSLNDFDAGIEASRTTVLTLRDSLTQAFEGIGSKSGSDILKDALRANLENLRRQVATVAANQITKGVFGESVANQVQSSDERLGAAGTKLFEAGTQLVTAAELLNQAAIQRSVEAGSLFPSAVPQLPIGIQGPSITGEPLASAQQQGPNPDGSVVSSAAQDLSQAGTAAGGALTAGAKVAASSIVAGGQGFLSSFLGGFGQSISGSLSKAILPALGLPGFKDGGLFDGHLTPLHNRSGGRYSQPTNIRVAEVPGLQEAVIPLKGGSIPVELRGGPKRGGAVDDTLEAHNAEIRRRVEPYGSFQGYQRAREREERALASAPARGGSRQARAQAATPRVVNVTKGGPTINMAPINITVTGSAANDPKLLAAQVGDQVRKAITAALESGSDRRFINAIRDAAR